MIEPTNQELIKIGTILRYGRWRKQDYAELMASEFVAEIQEAGMVLCDQSHLNPNMFSNK
jgi:hypothetical protein